MNAAPSALESHDDGTHGVVCVAVLVLASAFGLWHRRRDGRPRMNRDACSARLAAGEIGAERLGERATLLQFSTAFCQPCRATRRVLTEVAGMVEGVHHVEIDAADRLDLVRALGIVRTPTVLVLDAGGRVVHRGSGRPRKADVIAALGQAIP
jgi:thiol-disulfide isomerase/thioredoxin